MRQGDPIALRGASKALAPILALLAFGVAASGAPGAGVAGGAMLSLGLALHALIFGADAARRAVPPFAWRLIVLFAALAAALAVCAPGWRYAPNLLEAAACAAIAAGVALALMALAARAPTLRDEDW